MKLNNLKGRMLFYRAMITAVAVNTCRSKCVHKIDNLKLTGVFMKFSNLVASFGLLVLGSISINASAQTSVCTWSSVYGYTSGSYTYISFLCRNSSNAVIASRSDSYYIPGGYYNCGTPSVSAGYVNTGIKQGTSYPAKCNDIIVASNTPPASSSSRASSSASVCYTGEYQIIQTSPGSYPQFDPRFCGPQPQCKYSVTPLDPYSYPRLKYTCL